MTRSEATWAETYCLLRDGHDAHETMLIRTVLRATPSISAAARELGVSRYALMRSMVRLGIPKASRPSDPAATVTA